jgi:hypothetical protein
MNSYDEDVVDQASSCDLCLVMIIFAFLMIPIAIVGAMAGGVR